MKPTVMYLLVILAFVAGFICNAYRSPVGRYQVIAHANAIIRLDTKTGILQICAGSGSFRIDPEIPPKAN